METRFRAEILRFRIDVTVGKGYIKVSPDPAVVDEGTLVEWHISTDPNLPALDFELYFSAASPFIWNKQRSSLKPSDPAAGSTVISASAAEPGDYKYGVRATETKSGNILADDDPRLTVRSRRP